MKSSVFYRPRNLFKNVVEAMKKTKNEDRYWKLFEKYKAYTMIHRNPYCANLDLINHFKETNGIIVECGVWRGGMLASIAEVLGPRREYHAFDSFEGLPEAKEKDGLEAKKWQENKESPSYYNNCSAGQEFVTEAMAIAKAIKFNTHKGWFEQTVPPFAKNAKEIAILRLDGDWYESTMVCLKYLVPLVVKNGIVIIDDYYDWNGCSRAVHDFLSNYDRPLKLKQWLNTVAYFKVN